MPSSKPSLLRALAIGATAGLTATFIMGEYQALVAAGEKALEKKKKLAQGESPWLVAHEQVQKEQQAAGQEGSTEIVARKAAEAAGHPLTPEAKKQGGQVVHYTFGTLMGVAYCVGAEFLPFVSSGFGSVFGTALFVGADEFAIPALSLAPPPSETAASEHAEHWAAHLVYGTALELSRTLLRRML